MAFSKRVQSTRASSCSGLNSLALGFSRPKSKKSNKHDKRGNSSNDIYRRYIKVYKKGFDILKKDNSNVIINKIKMEINYDYAKSTIRYK